MKKERIWKMVWAAAAALLLTAAWWIDAADRPPRIVSPLWDMPPEVEEAVLSVERSYTRAADGTWVFNLEKPLTRLKIVRILRQGGTV